MGRLSEQARKVGCKNCTKQWAMHDNLKAVSPWDSQFEEFYKRYNNKMDTDNRHE